MSNDINSDFLKEISKIKDLQVFFGITTLLGIRIDEKPFDQVLEEVLDKFITKPFNKQKELVSILKKANKAR